MAVSLATVLLFPLRLLFPASPSRGRVADTPTTTGSVVPPGMLGFESASSSALFLAACLAHHPHNDGPSVFLKALYEFQDSECTFLLCALLAKCRVADVHAHIDAVIDKEQQQTNASTDNSALPVHRPWRISFAGLFDALAKYDTKHDCIHRSTWSDRWAFDTAGTFDIHCVHCYYATWSMAIRHSACIYSPALTLILLYASVDTHLPTIAALILIMSTLDR